MTWRLIFGPPCGGKSTYVETHADADAVVVDLDRIARGLGAAGDHERTPAQTALAIEAREAVLERLETDPPSDAPEVWIVATASTRADRDAWRARFPEASAVLVWAPPEVCQERAAAHRPQRWQDVIAQWFATAEAADPDEELETVTTTPGLNTAGKARTGAKAYGLKTSEDGTTGTVEAVVAVFGNVDRSRDRIIAGAFAKSLDRWRASGDRIPFIFSHRWDDLDAHVGEVVEVRELAAGAPELAAAGVPDDLAAGGGLYVKAELDLSDEEPFARRLWKRLRRRTIREFSFAYDVVKARPGEGGALDLLELDVIEVGPTLKGCNPATALLTAKGLAAGHDLDEIDRYRSDPWHSEWVAQVADDLEHLGAKDLADTLRGSKTSTAPSGLIDFAGSVEAIRSAVYGAAKVWADVEVDDVYHVHLEATYPAEGKAYAIVERWEDPLGVGPLYELAFDADDGSVGITDAKLLDVDITLTPAGTSEAAKARAVASLLRSPNGKDAARNLSPMGDHGKASPTGEAEADEPPTTTPAPILSALTDLDLIELDL